ncbi:MAG: hypothetical protein K8I02_09060, partial [Candidatus Methylomirabilis sp.]|nr:hypothetical protein [Deltaproteobacteria bacterium]
VWLALALLLALRFREARRLLPGLGAIAAAGVPLALYHRWVLAQEPLFQEYLARRDAFTALEVFAGYGLQAILALGALGAWLRVRNRRLDASVAWTLAAVLLLFLPISPGHQVFPMHALCLPVAALAAAALRALGESIPLTSLRALLYAGALGLAGLTNVLQERTELAMLRGELPEETRDRNLEGAINWYRAEMLRPGERLSALHLPREILAGLLALDNFSDGAAVVLAPPGLSTYLPYYAGVRAYAATGEQTVRYEEKQEAVQRFERALRAGDHRAARAFLGEAGLTHMLLLKDKPYLADLPEVPYLKRLWENGRVALWGVYLGAPDPAPESLP